MAKQLQKIHGEPSFHLESDLVKLAITKRGGHLGPVFFNLGKRWVAPYSLSPWQPEDCPKEIPAILRVLRGDFFCLPFGESEGGDPHGEPANLPWRRVDAKPGLFRMKLELKQPAGQITKTVRLRSSDRAIYQEHLIEGVRGRYNLGHHAILQFPETGGPYFVNVSPFRFGSTKPEPFTNPAIGEYSALKTNARFRSLDQVPLATGGKTDLRKYPARAGFEDLAMVSSRSGNFAWTAATLDGYIWISLKDPQVLPSTLFWFSNGGRHYPPWNGRHRGRLGLEEVNSYFNDGPRISRRNLLGKRGIPTTHLFQKNRPTRVRLIQLVHPVPRGFGMVSQVRRKKGGNGILIANTEGKTVDVPVDWNFLYERND